MYAYLDAMCEEMRDILKLYIAIDMMSHARRHSILRPSIFTGPLEYQVPFEYVHCEGTAETLSIAYLHLSQPSAPLGYAKASYLDV